jgi:hypothetical protein
MKLTGETYAKQLADRHHRRRAKVAGMRWTAAQALASIIRQTPLKLSEWTSDMGPMIKDAQTVLSRAIAAGSVQALGRKQPQDLVERIPSDPFRLPGSNVVIGPHGDMTTLAPHKPYVGPRWHLVEFEADEIKQAFPKPPPISAAEWMLREAGQHAGGPIAKRDDMVRRCMNETNCTKREAEAAHKSLPEGLKRKPGKPPKNPG